MIQSWKLRQHLSKTPGSRSFLSLPRPPTAYQPVLSLWQYCPVLRSNLSHWGGGGVMDLNGWHHHSQSQSSPWLSLQKMIPQGLYTSFLTSLPFMFYHKSNLYRNKISIILPLVTEHNDAIISQHSAPESHPRIKETYLIRHLSGSLHKTRVLVKQGWYSESTFFWYLLQWFLAPSIVRKMLQGTNFHRNCTWDTNCKVKVSQRSYWDLTIW